MIEEIANIFFLGRSCVCLSYGFVPIQGEPFACVRHSPHQLISGRVSTRSKVPHAYREGAGLQGGWDLSLPRHLSALARCRSHIHLGSHKLLLLVFDLRSSPLEDGTSRHQASFKVTP